VQQQER